MTTEYWTQRSVQALTKQKSASPVIVSSISKIYSSAAYLSCGVPTPFTRKWLVDKINSRPWVNNHMELGFGQVSQRSPRSRSQQKSSLQLAPNLHQPPLAHLYTRTKRRPKKGDGFGLMSRSQLLERKLKEGQAQALQSGWISRTSFTSYPRETRNIELVFLCGRYKQ